MVPVEAALAASAPAGRRRGIAPATPRSVRSDRGSVASTQRSGSLRAGGAMTSTLLACGGWRASVWPRARRCRPRHGNVRATGFDELLSRLPASDRAVERPVSLLSEAGRTVFLGARQRGFCRWRARGGGGGGGGEGGDEEEREEQEAADGGRVIGAGRQANQSQREELMRRLEALEAAAKALAARIGRRVGCQEGRAGGGGFGLRRRTRLPETPPSPLASPRMEGSRVRDALGRRGRLQGMAAVELKWLGSSALAAAAAVVARACGPLQLYALPPPSPRRDSV